MPRKLYQIADTIQSDGWIFKPAGFYARPYWNAMRDLSDITDNYGAYTAKSVVLYFLSNAGQWRGETARAVEAELKELMK